MSTVTTLVLTPNNPSNTTITAEGSDDILYIVETQHTNKRSITTFKNGNGDVLASSEWKDVQSDIITLGTNTPVPSSVWLKKSWVPFKE